MTLSRQSSAVSRHLPVTGLDGDKIAFWRFARDVGWIRLAQMGRFSMTNLAKMLGTGLFSCALIALQGCHPEVVGVTASIVGSMITSPRPDRLLNYEIELTTGADTLVFKGSTPCDHEARVLGPGSRHYYKTNNKYAYLKKDGREWILEGIDCQAGIEGREFGHYRLFKVKNDREAQLYFVRPGGKFRVTRAEFDSHVTIGTSRIATLDKYDGGPYFYRKYILNELTPTLSKLLHAAQEPTIVRRELFCKDPGGQEPTMDTNAFRRILFEENLKQRVDTIEEGYLRRTADGSGWELQPSDDVFVPLDVSTLVRFEPTDGSPKRLHANCLRVFLDGIGRPFEVDGQGWAYIYLPGERALISIKTLAYPELLLRNTSERNWKSCSLPSSLPKTTTGILFNNIPDAQSLLRVNLDGTASCTQIVRLGMP